MNRILGDTVAFTRARSDYKTQPIISTTISELDKITHDVDVLDDFTSLKQLIVDVVNQDSSDYVETNIVLGNNPQPWDVFIQHLNYLDSKTRLMPSLIK